MTNKAELARIRNLTSELAVLIEALATKQEKAPLEAAFDQILAFVDSKAKGK